MKYFPMAAPPTAENIAAQIFDAAQIALGPSLTVASVTVHETPTSSATFTRVG
jgi:hypothetical protein